MKKIKNVAFETEAYTMEDLEREISFLPIPWNYRDLYSVSLERYGFVHDMGYKVVLTPSVCPTGWETIAADLKVAAKEMLACAELAAEYAYH